MSTPSAVKSVSVPGTVPGIRQAMLAFEQFGRTHGLPAGAEWRVLLALDEILSNVVRYGDAGAEGIDLRFSLDRGGLTVEVVDSSAAFNPLGVPPPATAGPIAERRDGGLGIPLVRQLMDETFYERRDNRNHFIMKYGPHADR